jgi:ABC-2 type transport system permease protein
MVTKRIIAVLKQEYFITKRSMEIIFDIVFMPVMSIVVFGFLSSYLASTGNPDAAKAVLMGMVLWQVIFIIQYSIAVGSLWNIWSRNLSTMFVSPLQAREYILAHTISGILKAVLILVLSSITVYFLFDFNLLEMGLFNLLLIVMNFGIFAFSLGLMILGFIFRFGTKIQALAWGFLSFLQPLAAAFYPVSVLPPFFQAISYSLPATYVFESARYSLLTGMTDWRNTLIAFCLNLVYIVVGVLVFSAMFKKSKSSGQFARNEA